MIYLMRHGETLCNTQGRYQGLCNSPLTRKGREQAETVGRLLATELSAIPDVLDGQGRLPTYVSPLGRAQETAQIIAQQASLSLNEEPLVREVSLGAWDGMTLYEIQNEYPDIQLGKGMFDLCFASPDGESFEAALSRARKLLDRVETPIAIISHAIFGCLIRGVYLGLSREEMLRLPAPQNGFFRLKAGTVEFVGEEVLSRVD